MIATPAVQGAATTPGTPGYTPAQVLQAYGFDTQAATIGAVGGNGTGQTIAIVEAYNSPTLAADVHAFDQQFDLPDPGSLIEMNQTGGNSLPANNATWGLETSLDVEWAHAVAPGANIDVIEANSSQLSDLLAAVNTARELSDVSVVSMSWGVNEFASEKLFDSVFTTPPGHQNITFVASAGDTATASGVQWPAVSPNVVSVGGTTLETNSSGTAIETSYAGAVSGTSQYESSGVADTKSPIDVAVTSPDVVYNANPSPGFSVYDSAAGGWQTLGGTSAGAPQWAALLTIANQVRAEAGQSSLDGASQALPALQATALTTAGDTSAYGAVELLSASGTPQTAKVIDSLAAVTKSAPAPQASSSVAGIAAVLATNQAKLPKKPVHPFDLAPILAPVRPAATSALAYSQPVSVGAPLSTASLPSSAALTTPATSLAETIAAHGGNLMSLSEAMIAGALQLGAQAPSLAETIAAIYKAFPPIFGENEVVRVDAVLLSEQTAPQSLYIPQLNVSAMIGDGIALFINECLSRPGMSAVLEQPRTEHVRAWLITAMMIALDGALIGYVISRRRQANGQTAQAAWWQEPFNSALEPPTHKD